MGKKGKAARKAKKKVVVTPSFESPVCPTCGMADRIVLESPDTSDDPMWECCRCWVRFMYEDSTPDDMEEEESNMGMHGSLDARDFNGDQQYPLLPLVGLKCALCKGKGCEVCYNYTKPKGPITNAPEFGEIKELTDVAVRT